MDLSEEDIFFACLEALDELDVEVDFPMRTLRYRLSSSHFSAGVVSSPSFFHLVDKASDTADAHGGKVDKRWYPQDDEDLLLLFTSDDGLPSKLCPLGAGVRTFWMNIGSRISYAR